MRCGPVDRSSVTVNVTFWVRPQRVVVLLSILNEFVLVSRQQHRARHFLVLLDCAARAAYPSSEVDI